jgi:hypothetical protein
VVVAVVTSSFVVLNWCSAKLGIVRAMGCRLMPVRGEAGVVHPLMPLCNMPTRRPIVGWLTSRCSRRCGCSTVAGGWPHGANLFPGLEPFTAAFSRVFFGRAAEAREVGNRVRAMGPGGGSWPSSVRPAAGNHHRSTPASVAIIGCP